MVISRKAVLSLLISVLLFAGFTVLAFTGLFDLVEIRFYNPSVTKALSREIDEDTETIEEFLLDLQTRFAATLQDEAVRRSFLSNLSGEDIVQREKLYGTLLESLGGLQSVRFIDSIGSRIHYSTWQPDILRKDENSIAYRNYNDTRNDNGSGYIPYGQIEVPDQGDPRLTLDEVGERILFSHPFYDSFEVYRGTAIFSLSVRAVVEKMILAGRIKVGEDISIISEPPGIVAGLPYAGKSTLIPLISSVWRENILSLSRLKSDLTETSLVLISEKTARGIYIGRLVNESLLIFPMAMRIILLISFLLTVYLIIFLLFNIRQDNMTVIQNRLKQLQINLIEEYYEHKGELDWNHWQKELEQRREDVHSELKRGLKNKTQAGENANIDLFIDKSWDDLIAIIGGHTERRSGLDEEKIKALLNHLLLTAPASPSPQVTDEPPEIPDLEELEEAEAIDELEAMEDITQESVSAPELTLEEVSLEDLEKLEVLEELSESEGPVQVEDLMEEVSLEDLNALPDREQEDLDELEELEPTEAISEFQELDPSTLGGPEEISDTAMESIASIIEFSPIPEEIEKEKDAAAESMVDNFDIQSPFATIFSTLSEVEFEPEPFENLESLEREGLVLDDAPEIEALRLSIDFVKTMLSVPFLSAMNTEIETLEVQDDDEPVEVEDAEDEAESEKAADEETQNESQEPSSEEQNAIIAERDGVSYIKENVLSPDAETIKGLDRNFKNLIDSILNND